MAHGHRGVARLQQHGDGFPDHKAATDDRRPLAGGIDAVVIQNLHTALRGAGGVSLAPAGEHRKQGGGGHAVHILAR